MGAKVHLADWEILGSHSVKCNEQAHRVTISQQDYAPINDQMAELEEEEEEEDEEEESEEDEEGEEMQSGNEESE